jgi:hypothetical protein
MNPARATFHSAELSAEATNPLEQTGRAFRRNARSGGSRASPDRSFVSFPRSAACRSASRTRRSGGAWPAWATLVATVGIGFFRRASVAWRCVVVCNEKGSV